MEPLIDIHSHLIPEIDDGANSVEEALQMARMAAVSGVSTMVATPHQLGSYFATSASQIRKAVADLQEMLSQHEIALEVLPGADVRVDGDLVEKIQRDEVMTLADRRKHILLEFPHRVALPIERLLAGLGKIGIVGILTHPERNRALLQSPNKVRDMIAQGCHMQVTAGSFVGEFGARSQEMAEWMLRNDMVHFVASDAHGVERRKPNLRDAFDRICELASHETALEICCRNPARAVAGRDVPIQPARRCSPRGGFFQSIRESFVNLCRS